MASGIQFAAVEIRSAGVGNLHRQQIQLVELLTQAAAAGIVAKMLSEISNQGLASYSDAGDIVEQTIGSIRTVGP